MKRSAELLGLSVISIEDGKELGRVSDLIINPSKGIIQYFIIDNGLKYLGFKILPFQLVEGVGEYAVTVQSSSAVSDMSEEPEINGLLEKDVRVKGTKILTKKGKLVGTVADFVVDEEDGGKIHSCLMEPVAQKGVTVPVTSDNIITFGKDVLVIGTEPELTGPGGGNGNDVAGAAQSVPAVNKPAVQEEEPKQEISKQAEQPEAEVKPVVSQEPAAAPVAEQAAPDQPKAEQPKAEPTKAEEKPEQQKQEKSEAARLFEQRQRQYLMGRKVSKRIESDKGEVIAEEGQVITNELIDKAKAAGKFSELSMNTRS